MWQVSLADTRWQIRKLCGQCERARVRRPPRGLSDSWRAESVHVTRRGEMAWLRRIAATVFLSRWQDNCEEWAKNWPPLSARHRDTVSHLITSAQHTSTAACENTLGLILVVHTHMRACVHAPIILVVYDGVIAGTLAGIRNEAVRGSDSESYRSAVAKLNKCVCASVRVSVCPWDSTV